MTYYSPAAYAGLYHAIPIIDTRLGVAVTLDIQRYVNGWSAENQAEYYRLLSKLAGKLKLKTPAAVRALSQPFYIKDHAALINPAEEWYDRSLSRAYACRASPDEIADAVRLAHFCGMTNGNPKAYGEKWFGLDCNTFVGNWLGISPSSAIFAYAVGYGKSDKLAGATPDVYATRNRLPLALVTDPAKIIQGTVACTFGEKDGRGFRWRHIALVEKCELVQGSTYNLWLAEWGTKGNIEKHRTPPGKPRVVQITSGKFCAEMPTKEVLAFDGKDPGGNPAKRIFFDGSSLDDLPHRGWHVGGMYGV